MQNIILNFLKINCFEKYDCFVYCKVSFYIGYKRHRIIICYYFLFISYNYVGVLTNSRWKLFVNKKNCLL